MTCESQVQTPPRTVFDVVICLLVAGSYIPQILKIKAEGGTAGISAWYIILLTISSSTQLAARTENDFSQLAFECVRGGHLRGWKAFSALVMYLQSILQWICTVILLIVYVKFRNDENRQTSKSVPVSGAEANTVIDHGAYATLQQVEARDSLRPASSMSNTAVLATVVTHACIILPVAFVILILGPPDDYKDGFGSEVDYSIIQRTFHVILALSGLATAISSATPQIRLIFSRFRDGEGLGSLSVLGLGLQALAFVGLGVSQGLRLGWPHIGDRSQPPISVWAWFLGVNGPAVGFTGLGLSQLVVLGAALGFRRTGGRIAL